MIRTVIFDLGRVLIPFDFNRGYRAMERLCNYPAEEIPRRISGTDIVQRFESGLMEPEEFVAKLRSILGLNIGYEEFCDIWSSIFLPDPLVPEEMLAGIRKRHRLLLLSNTNAIHFGMIRANYPLLAHFDDFILSYQVKAMKPSPAIYRAALQRAQCPAENCFFTDDIAAYVEAALREGIDAVQFRSLEQIQQELAARGVRWD